MSEVDPVKGVVVRRIVVGRHPTGLVWDQRRGCLYVAEGNDDAVAVVDTRSGTVVGRIAIAPFAERRPGLAPTALALSPDAATLYVALGGVNAVAAYDVTDARVDVVRLRGMIPTGWYPTSIDASSDGRYLAVGSLFGQGSGNGAPRGAGGVAGVTSMLIAAR
ncbi:MAG: hypothetical protein U0163_03070 [Gemmatimonadaceae bacterium]